MANKIFELKNVLNMYIKILMVFFEKTGNYVENSDYFSDYKGY